jgi:pimeloyl-ACP methyl ester carboxylesterase
MAAHRPHRLRLLVAVLAGVLMLTGFTLAAASASPTTAEVAKTSAAPKPTIVLVHGAFADSSGWNAVASRLLGEGYPVIAFSNPLRGPARHGWRTPAPAPVDHRRAGRAGRALLRWSGDHQCRDG